MKFLEVEKTFLEFIKKNNINYDYIVKFDDWVKYKFANSKKIFKQRECFSLSIRESDGVVIICNIEPCEATLENNFFDCQETVIYKEKFKKLSKERLLHNLMDLYKIKNQ